MLKQRKSPRVGRLFQAIVVCGASLTACGGVVQEPEVTDSGPEGGVTRRDAAADAKPGDADLPDAYLPPIDAGMDDAIAIMPPTIK